jgi:hypothetical protein
MRGQARLDGGEKRIAILLQGAALPQNGGE